MGKNHTPGPWKYHDHAGWILGNNQRIAYVYLADKETEQELPHLRNGDLMAAAPELLDALEDLFLFFTDPDRDHEADLDRAAELIKKLKR